MDVETRLQLSLAQLDRTQAFFPRVEGKASFLLAVNLSLIAAAFAAVSWKTLESNALIAVLLVLVFSLCAASLVFVYFTFAPHLGPAVQTSALYFSDISKLDPIAFVKKWRDTSSDELLDDALHQVARNSEILSKKFNAAEGAFILTALAVIPWVVLLGFCIFEQQTFVFGD